MIEPEIFDTIIIGGGPAGLSAAIYAVRKSLKVLLITREIGGQAALSGDVENYLGFSIITGADLASKFRENVERFKGDGIWIKEGVLVKSVEGTEGNFIVKTESNEYHSKTVIIASGRTPRMLNVPGEKEFFGKGVATCATCDGPLYKGKEVVIVGGG
ncbi:FAD-dependent oxidoreductase, partial [Candidatus Daviesbacteria bacterium]|nr:FAD-dependent oxidoreductase [Candidatus Daviesbacteria bacterium]